MTSTLPRLLTLSLVATFFVAIADANAQSGLRSRLGGSGFRSAPAVSAPTYNSAPVYSAPSYSAPSYNSAPVYSAPTYTYLQFCSYNSLLSAGSIFGVLRLRFNFKL